MNYNIEFNDWYLKILRDFSFNIQKDRESRDYLSQILKKKKKDWNFDKIILSFTNHVRKKSNIIIYGCGPSLELFFEKIDGKSLSTNCLNLAADGASILLRKKGVNIDAIFTDLDGITPLEFYHANFIIVHAHGDNIDKLKYFEKDIINHEKVLGTTQAEPVDDLINPGGFTDGDRILYFLRSFLLPKHKIFFIGMDFGNIIGKYSKPGMALNQEGSPIKVRKLKYAFDLIDWINNKIKNDIYFVNSKQKFKKFNYISLDEFKREIQFL